MSRLRVLWLSNQVQSAGDAGRSGTWLRAMAESLVDKGEVNLANIAGGHVSQMERRDCGVVQQWVIPFAGFSEGSDGLPRRHVVDRIIEAVEAFCPEIIHVWGTEQFWGLLTARGILGTPALLEMQGLKGQIAKVFYGGLTLSERLHCIGIKELVKRRTMRADRRDCERWGIKEEEIIRGHSFVDVQSSWVAAHVKAVNPGASLFPINLTLRKPFYDVDGWQPPARPTLFCTAAYTSPFKGLHVAVRALASLKKRISNVRLRIAGAHQRPGIRQEGYMRWINSLIQKLGLADEIEWLGPLSAEQIVMELKNAAAMVIPTFIENCCTTMQEAMVIGTPVVVSYVGGIPSLARGENSCLFFPPGDEAMCAYQVERLLTKTELALRLSRESRRIALVRNDRQAVASRQLQIYRQVLRQGIYNQQVKRITQPEMLPG